MRQFQSNPIVNRSLLDVPRLKTYVDLSSASLSTALASSSLVVARYADDGKWYRAWIKSICLERQQATVFFVDFGNDSSVAFADICSCPASVRSLPWLGIRIRLTPDETMT